VPVSREKEWKRKQSEAAEREKKRKAEEEAKKKKAAEESERRRRESIARVTLWLASSFQSLFSRLTTLF
jgi:hypothetical protein